MFYNFSRFIAKGRGGELIVFSWIYENSGEGSRSNSGSSGCGRYSAAPATDSFPVLFPDFNTADFTAYGFGKLRDEINYARVFIGRGALLDIFLNLSF